MEIVKKNKQRKLTVIIGAVFLLGIITISIIFANRPSSEDLVNEFENAVLTSDTNTLEKLIESPNKDMKVTKEDVEQFISYAKDNNEYTQELVFILHAQRAILEEDNQARLQNPIFENATEGEIKNAGDFYLEKDGGLFGGFHIYARPYSLKVSANQPDTVITLNGKKVFETKKGQLEETITGLAPSKYTITGTKKYEFANIQTKDEVSLFDDEERQSEIELDVEGKKIGVEATIENVEIFVNGKTTGKKAEMIKEDVGGLFGNSDDDEETNFGPVSTDGSIKVHGEVTYPWGAATSVAQTVGEDTVSVDVTPKPFGEKENKDKVVQVINDFAKQRVQALVQQNASVIKTASDNIVKEYAEDIQFDKSNENYWKGTALGTRIDFGNVTLSKEKDQYRVKLPVELHSEQKQYYGWNEDDPLEEVFEEYLVVATYDEKSKQWTIDELEDYYSDDEFMKGKDVVKSEFK